MRFFRKQSVDIYNNSGGGKGSSPAKIDNSKKVHPMVELKKNHRRFCYGREKGNEKYPESIKNKIQEKQKNGQTVKLLSKEYGINQWVNQTCCGLSKEHKRIQKVKVRKPVKTLQK